VTDPNPYTQESSHYKQRSIAESDRSTHHSVYTPSYLVPKPKKKFGPRPHVETPSRPKTSGSAKSSGAPKPVANLPTSVQVSNRANSITSFRPGSQQSSKSIPTHFTYYRAPVLPPLPSLSNVHIASLYKSPQTRTAQSISQTNPLAPTASPEKLRLMKALQMRKKNQILAQRSSTLTYVSREKESTDVPIQKGRFSSANQEVTESREAVKSDPHSAKPGDEFDTVQDSMSSTASPISVTDLSEKPSTQSSFTTDNDRTASRGSISSDTGSSVTPRAGGQEGKRRRLSNSKKEERDDHNRLTVKPDTFEGLLVRTPQTPCPEPARKPDISAGSSLTNIELLQHSQLETEHATTLGALNQEEFKKQEPAKPNSPAPKSTLEESNPIGDLPGIITEADRKSAVGETQGGPADRKCRGKPNPLRTVSSPETSEVSDDDSFIDELQHAKVEEAKPISVARTPATPIYSRGSPDPLKELSRAPSTPVQKPVQNHISPERPRTGSTRSVSSNLPQWPPASSETVPVTLAKKGTLSSGISKRIKALEVFSSRDSIGNIPSPPQAITQKPSRLNMPSFRKRSSFIPHSQPSNASINTTPSKEPPLPERIPTQEQNTSVQPIPWVQRQGSNTEINAPTHKGESISVTAHIVRNKGASDVTKSEDPTLPVIMNLHRSPLVVEQHGRDESMSARSPAYREVSFQSQETTARSPQSEKTRFSFNSHRSASQTRLHTSESMASRISIASKIGAHTKPGSISDNSSLVEEKKDSRASRLKKRMSALSTGSRRSLLGALSPKKRENQSVTTITEQNEAPPREISDTDSMTHVVDIGDLNVQFPDTLLWKRRFMRIDDQGYVIFSPPAMERNPRGISRKFHLSEFRKPRLPDNEREEMRWSIKLDLGDGSCIQCACESKHAQEQVLISK
jgi:hypothetical protein